MPSKEYKDMVLQQTIHPLVLIFELLHEKRFYNPRGLNGAECPK